MCNSCMPERLPWDRERSLGALFATTWLVIAHGPRTFASQVGVRTHEPVVSYASAVTVATLAPVLVLALLAGETSDDGGLAFVVCCWITMTVPIAVASQLFRGALYGFFYHGMARLLGGQGSPSSSFSAAYVSLGLFPAQLLLMIGGTVPTLLAPQIGIPGTIAGVGVAYLASVLWGAALVIPHARERHGLSPGRAVIAALGPSLLGLAVYALSLGRVMPVLPPGPTGD